MLVCHNTLEVNLSVQKTSEQLYFSDLLLHSDKNVKLLIYRGIRFLIFGINIQDI